MMLDVALVGGTVIDGLGGPSRREDVGILDGRVSFLGDLSRETAGRTIDVSGKTIVPGFVDIHSHSDLSIISDGRARSKVMQGVTTEVVGNCGLGPFPLEKSHVSSVRESIGIIDLDPAISLDWEDFPGYCAAVSRARPAINIAPLVAHNPLRLFAAPNSNSVLSARELDCLVEKLEEELSAGAIGFSTGLMYPPAMAADRQELLAIAEVVSANNRLFAIHARNYSTHLLDAVDEALEIALATGCRLQFSHLAVAGRANWGSVATALERIDDARARGADVGVDIYPYLAGSANLSQILPTWAQSGGAEGITARIESNSDRRRIVKEWQDLMVLGWDEITISFVDGDLEGVLGLTIEEIGALWSIPPAEAALEIIRLSRNRAMMVAFGRSMEDLIAVLRFPSTSIGSDGLSLDPDGPTGAGIPHPRSYGCYPRLIGEMVPQGAIGLERAIAMCTSIPATRLGLKDRGRIELGAIADVAVIDRETFLDNSTYTQPAQFPGGLCHLLVAGNFVVENGHQLDDVRPGRVLRVD